MKVFHFLPIAAFCLMTGACSTGKKQAELTAGIQLANLDTTALPGTDFYQYACGGWMKNNPIPAEYSQYGSFTILAENNRKQIQGLIEELAATQHEPGSVAQKIGDLYKIVMDSVKLNKDGVAPIKAELDQLGALKDKKELYALLGEMQKKGIVAYNILYVGADEMNSSMNAVQSYQAGLSMGERATPYVNGMLWQGVFPHPLQLPHLFWQPPHQSQPVDTFSVRVCGKHHEF